MLAKTSCIILHTLPYKESSVISNVYTREYGRLSLITSGVRKQKPLFHPNLFQPLTMLDVVIYYKENGQLHRVKEIKPFLTFQEIPFHIEKNCIALFVAEILYKVLREQEKNEDLFEFLLSGIEMLDHLQEGISNFHPAFLLQLTKYMGFYPENNFNDLTCYFNISKGKYYSFDSNDSLSLPREISIYWQKFLNIPLQEAGAMILPPGARKTIIKALLDYYTLHFGSLGDIKSYAVLQQVFHQ